MVMQQSIVQRDVERLRSNLFRIPAIITAFLYFPEILVLIAVFGCLCHALHAGQFPMVVYLLLVANGVLTNNSRNYSVLTIWNDPGTQPAPAPTLEEINNMPAYASSLLKANSFIISQLSYIVHELEVFHNILTFADPRVSIICYGALLAFTIVSTLWLTIFSLVSYVFVLGSLFFAMLTFTTFAQEQAAALSSNSVYLPIAQAMKKGYAKWQAVRSRVPDELEMQHRYICTLAITKESAAGMMDAATDFVTSPPLPSGSAK